jgi:hypothetical protein
MAALTLLPGFSPESALADDPLDLYIIGGSGGGGAGVERIRQPAVAVAERLPVQRMSKAGKVGMVKLIGILK